MIGKLSILQYPIDASYLLSDAIPCRFGRRAIVSRAMHAHAVVLVPLHTISLGTLSVRTVDSLILRWIYFVDSELTRVNSEISAFMGGSESAVTD